MEGIKKIKKIKKVELFPNNKAESLLVAQQLEQKLKSRGYVITSKGFDLAIAIGGDGSFLKMVNTCEFNDKIYYVGVNTGTLGFAQEIYPKEIDSFLDRLDKRECKEE